MSASTATGEDMAGRFKVVVMGEMNERGFAQDNIIPGLGNPEEDWRSAVTPLRNLLALCCSLGLTFHRKVPRHRALTECALSRFYRRCNTIAIGVTKWTCGSCLFPSGAWRGCDGPGQVQVDPITWSAQAQPRERRSLGPRLCECTLQCLAY